MDIAPLSINFSTTGPLIIITGKKNIVLNNPLNLTSIFNIIAIANENTNIIGT